MSPHTTSPRRARARVAALALAGTLALTGCSQATEDAITADLEKLTADAQAQLDSLSADAQNLTDQLGDLPEGVRTAGDEAVAAAKDGSEKAQAALADSGLNEENADQAAADAQQALDDATVKLTDLKATLDASTPPDVVATIDALQADVDALKQKILDAS